MMLDSTNNKIRVSLPGEVKLNITTTHGEVSLLEGKYSESFVKELTRQISAAIESAVGVVGLADSSVEVDMVYSPESFMEHTSDGVTYRRLLMSAKGCAARDFWVKWHGKGGEPLSSAAEVSSEDIVFYIGEDVPHKVREREYRYLVHGNSDKYRTAMGKKNITEWREIIKRAVKRGELTKTVREAEVSSHSEEVADKLADLLERFNINLPKDSVTSDTSTDDIAELAKSKLMERGINEEQSELPYYPEEESVSENADEVFTHDFISSLEISAPQEQNLTESFSFEPEYDSLSSPAAQGESEDSPFAESGYAFLEAEAEEQVKVPSADFDIPMCDADSAADSCEIQENGAPSTSPIEAFSRLGSQEEILRVRLNEESLARSEAEERVIALTAERDALAAELENMKAALSAIKDTFDKTVVDLTAERDALSAKLELEEAAHRRDKELFAEAARQAKEESDRIVREREEELRRKAAEEARLAEEKIREAESAREEEIRRLEVLRIERDIRSREEDKRGALERAQELSRAMEREAMLKVQSIGLAEPKPYSGAVSAAPVAAVEEAQAAEPAKPAPIGPENHPYTSVSAKLIFRHNVDPNVKGRLYEIISRALEYYKKEHVYIKLKASIPEPAAVMLNFEQFPEGEDELLRGIVKLIGNSDLGVMKIIVE